jgi:DMSO/TMAO reductase YedYZ molybdopterin-dependent catalytic subunit
MRNIGLKSMEKVKQHKRLVIVTSLLLLATIMSMGIYWRIMPQGLQPSPSPTPASSSSSPSPLPPQEIREYQGQDLSSINDFRENSIKGPQNVNATTYRLTVTGLVNKTVEYTYDEVISKFQKYKKVVTLHCVEGWSVTILWEGFLVTDLLQEAGIDPRGQVVIFRAYDGYSTSLPLDYIVSNDILIAYKMNDVVLPTARGFPFELVAESKYGYKWIKWITEIELSDNVNYRGYWESRGFPNNADTP